VFKCVSMRANGGVLVHVCGSPAAQRSMCVYQQQPHNYCKQRLTRGNGGLQASMRLCASVCVQVQSLAQELSLDRSTVLYWVKEFWKKPEL